VNGVALGRDIFFDARVTGRCGNKSSRAFSSGTLRPGESGDQLKKQVRRRMSAQAF
jgi:hypothetical protein